MNWKFWESRSQTVSSKDPYLGEKLGIRANAAGQWVTPETATGIPAVHACVQLIAETVASLPLAPYRRTEDGGKIVDNMHPLYRVLHDQANQIQTSLEFREQLIASCLLTGNGYALKELDGRGSITELLPLHPSHMRPVRLVNGRVRYEFTPEHGGTQKFTQDEILHVRYRSTDGYTGLSPISIARQTVGLALAQQSFESAFYRNNATIGGALKHPQRLTVDQITNLQSTFEENYSGTSNAFRMIILEEGMEFQAMGMSMLDAQFVESRKLTLEDVARIYRIPPPAIGILDRATYSNITEQSRSLVMHTLRPWLVRVEQAMNASLLTQDGRRSHFIEHNAEGLLRGTQKDRYEAYQIGREWGWLNVNEIRRRENLSNIGKEGDVYSQGQRELVEAN